MTHNCKCKIDSKLTCKASDDLEQAVAQELQIPDPQEAKANLNEIADKQKETDDPSNK